MLVLNHQVNNLCEIQSYCPHSSLHAVAQTFEHQLMDGHKEIQIDAELSNNDTVLVLFAFLRVTIIAVRM